MVPTLAFPCRGVVGTRQQSFSLGDLYLPTPCQVSGGITMHAFKFEIANVYRNLTNVLLRLAPADPAAAARKAVLVNSHYDSTLGTVGEL